MCRVPFDWFDVFDHSHLLMQHMSEEEQNRVKRQFLAGF